MMSTNYKAINCDFHELILANATLKKECLIVYRKESKSIAVTDVIVDVYTKKGEEFMVLASDEIIRLDFIISIDNQKLPKYSCTF